MRALLLLTIILSSPLQASQEKPVYKLTIVDADIFGEDFWDTPAGLAFWETPEGKAVLQAMFDYQHKIENKKK